MKALKIIWEAISMASLFIVVSIYIFQRSANVDLLITAVISGALWALIFPVVFSKVLSKRTS